MFAGKTCEIPTVQTSTNRFLAYFLLALSMSLVGSYVALSKPLVSALPVFLLAWLRFGIGGLAMPHWLKTPPDEVPMTTHTKKLVFLESLFGNFLFTICMLFGISMTSAVSAGVIMASIPAVVAVMSWWFLNEKISRRVALAILFVALGTLLFSISNAASMSPIGWAPESAVVNQNAFWGNLLIFGAVVCEAAYAVIGKRLTASLSPKRITALINLWGFVLMTPMGLYAAWSFDFSSIAVDVWFLLVFYALAASVGTVWLWMTGLKSIPAAKAGIFTVMLPISTAAVGVIFLNETLTNLQWLAFTICLLGVLLATSSGGDITQTNKSA
jgi:drug/metabolite transporter (DMT)-like permease